MDWLGKITRLVKKKIYGYDGIVIKIDGKKVTRKQFEKFIADHKEEFVKEYNKVYDERIRKKEEDKQRISEMNNRKDGDQNNRNYFMYYFNEPVRFNLLTFSDSFHLSNHLNYLFRTDKKQKWTNTDTRYNIVKRVYDGNPQFERFEESLLQPDI